MRWSRPPRLPRRVGVQRYLATDATEPVSATARRTEGFVVLRPRDRPGPLPSPRRTPRGLLPGVAVLAALLLMVTAPAVLASSSVGGPGGTAYADDEACIIPWIQQGRSVVVEGVTVRAPRNVSEAFLGIASSGRFFHGVDLFSGESFASTRLRFDPPVSALEVTVELLGDVTAPDVLPESYRIVGRSSGDVVLLDWTLTDQDAQESGVFAPGIATLSVEYEPKEPGDGLAYGATIRFRVPKEGDDCDVTFLGRGGGGDADDDEGPVPASIPSGRSTSDGALPFLLGIGALVAWVRTRARRTWTVEGPGARARRA